MVDISQKRGHVTYFRCKNIKQSKCQSQCLELNHLSLALLLSTQLEVLGSLDGALILPLALSTLQPQNQLLGGLGLLSQDRLGLTSKSLLLTIVPTSSLSLLGLSGFLVLGHLHLGVLVALGAVGVTTLGHVHHLEAVIIFFSCRSESSNISNKYVCFDK